MEKLNLKAVGVVVLAVMMVCVAGCFEESKTEKKVCLRPAIKASIKAMFPGAEIEEVKMAPKVYEVEVEQGDEEFEVQVWADGTIIEVESRPDAGSLPAAVKAAIDKAVPGATVKKVEKEVRYSVVKPVPLETVEVVYEAELVKDGKKSAIAVAANGRVLELKAKTCKKKDNDDEDEDEDKNDDDEDEDDDEDDEDDDKDDDKDDKSAGKNVKDKCKSTGKDNKVGHSGGCC